MLDVDTDPWPFPLYHRSLLTIVWAFYISAGTNYDENITPRTRRLVDSLVAALRAADFFCGETAASQRRKHTPSDLFPIRFMLEQQHKSFIAHLFKADAQLAIITQQPPALHACELDVALPATFSQLSCYGVCDFTEWHELLARLRPDRRISRFLESPEPAATFGGTQMLVEDIHLGLCGLVPRAWELARTSRSNDDSQRACRLHEVLTSRLAFWRGHLLAFHAAMVTDGVLRSVYTGKEDQPDHVMSALSGEADVMYHLLSLLANTHAPSQPGPIGRGRISALPGHAMRNIYHAVCIGALHLSGDKWKGCRPPLLDQARIFARECVITMMGDECWCTPPVTKSQINLALLDAHIEKEDELYRLSLSKFWLHVDGAPLCTCRGSGFLFKTGLIDTDEVNSELEGG